VQAPSQSTTPADTWDNALWDVARWDASQNFYIASTKWVTIGKTGYAHAPTLQVTNGNGASPTAELVIMEVTYEPGALVV